MFTDHEPNVPIQAIETVSGRYVDVFAPRPEMICVTDIAWAISRQVRFAGHTLSTVPWTVGQHSIFVLDLVELLLDPEGNGELLYESACSWIGLPIDQLRTDAHPMIGAEALFHDGTEAYLIDLPSPIKRQFESYRDVERELHKVIRLAVGIPEMPLVSANIVKWADMLALALEAAVMLPSRGRGWHDLPQWSIEMLSLVPTPKYSPEVYKDFLFHTERQMILLNNWEHSGGIHV